MKMYTNRDQTAKLIELGFEKPNSIEEFIEPENDWSIGGLKQRKAYSIGELIEMLPKSLKNPYNPPLAIECNKKWRVYYGVPEDYSWEWSIWFEEERKELIDALYGMLIKLKKNGVI